MRGTVAMTALICALSTAAVAQSTPRQDAMLDGYFALWDNNASVTPEMVAKLYGPQIVYYGHPMSRADLYRDKLDFIRRWPHRSYRVEPGSARKRCDDAGRTCVLSAVLDWQTAGARRARSGRSRISLTISDVDGGKKIVKEGAVTLPR